jgi:hypothetical protein
VIVHRLHLASSPESVWELIATDDGRETFWTETSRQVDAVITLTFPNRTVVDMPIVDVIEGKQLVVSYFGERTEFALESDGSGGTELTLRCEAEGGDAVETNAGWVSVLMALKASADFGVDLRNHDPARTWDNGYVDN